MKGKIPPTTSDDEFAVCFAAGTGREVERGRGPARRAVPERDCPQAVDGDECLVTVTQLALEDPLAAATILVRAHAPVPEVADKNVAREHAEARRCKGEAPRRVRRRVLPASGRNAGDELAVRRELIDVAEPVAGHVVLLRRVLLRVRDEDAAREGLDAERRVALRELRILERRAGNRLERGVEDVDVVVVEVGRIEAIVDGREAFVDRARP